MNHLSDLTRHTYRCSSARDRTCTSPAFTTQHVCLCRHVHAGHLSPVQFSCCSASPAGSAHLQPERPRTPGDVTSDLREGHLQDRSARTQRVRGLGMFFNQNGPSEPPQLGACTSGRSHPASIPHPHTHARSHHQHRAHTKARHHAPLCVSVCACRARAPLISLLPQKRAACLQKPICCCRQGLATSRAKSRERMGQRGGHVTRKCQSKAACLMLLLILYCILHSVVVIYTNCV